ncbi:MAG: small nuclear ribonucleoprotein (snRNP)-like protein [Verrucomicrobiales bacterium]|jgi:small nuclear ribonucleoprotein (snRNP)-like protein
MADQLDFNFDDNLSPEEPDPHPRKPILPGAGQNAQPSSAEVGLFEFGSAAGDTEDGFERWRASNRERRRAISEKLGLPLGKNVEVTLRNGTVLSGPLQLCDASLKSMRETGSKRDERRQLRLSIHRADFSASEIVSCVTTDE